MAMNVVGPAVGLTSLFFTCCLLVRIVGCCEVVAIDHYTENACQSSVELDLGFMPSEVVCARLCQLEESCLSLTYNWVTLACRGKGQLLPGNCVEGSPGDKFYLLTCKAARNNTACSSVTPCFVDSGLMECDGGTCRCVAGYESSFPAGSCE